MFMFVLPKDFCLCLLFLFCSVCFFAFFFVGCCFAFAWSAEKVLIMGSPFYLEELFVDFVDFVVCCFRAKRGEHFNHCTHVCLENVVLLLSREARRNFEWLYPCCLEIYLFAFARSAENILMIVPFCFENVFFAFARSAENILIIVAFLLRKWFVFA